MALYRSHLSRNVFLLSAKWKHNFVAKRLLWSSYSSENTSTRALVNPNFSLTTPPIRVPVTQFLTSLCESCNTDRAETRKGLRIIWHDSDNAQDPGARHLVTQYSFHSEMILHSVHSLHYSFGFWTVPNQRSVS